MDYRILMSRMAFAMDFAFTKDELEVLRDNLDNSGLSIVLEDALAIKEQQIERSKS